MPAEPASFLTGLYPNTIHVNRNGNAYFPANERVRLITRRLADRGYDCGLAGKLHIASCWTGAEPRVDDGYRVFHLSTSALQFVGRGNAYTDWLTRIGRLDEAIDTSGIDPARNSGARYRPDIPPELHQSAWCADRAIEFIKQDRGGPWLMSVNIFDPHGPFDAPAPTSSATWPRNCRRRSTARPTPTPRRGCAAPSSSGTPGRRATSSASRRRPTTA